jgi:hypothetical protein
MSTGRAARLAYKPVGIVLGMVASAVSAAAFRQVWKRVGGGETAPDARDPDRDWLEIILAAALEGAIYAGVRAAADRAGASMISSHRSGHPSKIAVEAR